MKTIHNLLNVVAIGSGIMLICLLVLLATGFRPYILTSASMEPTISKGSLVFTKHTELDDVQEGDVIVYRSNGSLVLHRYLGDNQIAGDANNISQSIHLTASNYVGTYACVTKIVMVLLTWKHQIKRRKSTTNF